MAGRENLSQVGAKPHPANIGFAGLLDQVGDIIVDLSNHQQFGILQCGCFPSLDDLSNAFALSDAAAEDKPEYIRPSFWRRLIHVGINTAADNAKFFVRNDVALKARAGILRREQNGVGQCVFLIHLLA
jgi:hypothetical protein